MAKIKYSALVSDMRNKLNGSVMSANRYGSYVRNKVTPVNPQTVFQQVARSLFGSMSANWRDLTTAQRDAWNNAAKDFPFTDIFGDTKHLSGQSLFVKLNGNLAKIGLPIHSNAPSPVGFPVLELGNINAAQSGDNLTSLTVNYTIDDVVNETIPSGYKLVLYATDAVPNSISFVKNRFRFLGAVTAPGGAPLDITSLYIDRFGTVKPGTRIFIRAALVATESGQQSVPASAAGELMGPEAMVSFTQVDIDLDGVTLAVNFGSGNSTVPTGYRVDVYGYAGSTSACPDFPTGGTVRETIASGASAGAIVLPFSDMPSDVNSVRAELVELSSGSRVQYMQACVSP